MIDSATRRSLAAYLAGIVAIAGLIVVVAFSGTRVTVIGPAGTIETHTSSLQD